MSEKLLRLLLDELNVIRLVCRACGAADPIVIGVLSGFEFNWRFLPKPHHHRENAINVRPLSAASRASPQIFAPHFLHRLSFRLSECFHPAAMAAPAA